MDLNAGYTRRSGDGSNAPHERDAVDGVVRRAVATRAASAGSAECYGYPGTGGPAGQASIVALLAGPTFLARTWLAFDAGVIVPVTGPQPHALYAGAVYNVGRIVRRGS